MGRAMCHAPRRLESPPLEESYIHLTPAPSLQNCSLSLVAVLRHVAERLQSSDLVGYSVTAAVGLLQRWDALLNDEGVAMLLSVVLDIRNCLFSLCGKLSSRESWEL